MVNGLSFTGGVGGRGVLKRGSSTRASLFSPDRMCFSPFFLSTVSHPLKGSCLSLPLRV